MHTECAARPYDPLSTFSNTIYFSRIGLVAAMINQETDLASRPISFDHYLKHIDKSGYVNQATFTSKLTYFLEIMKTCQNPMPRLKV